MLHTQYRCHPHISAIANQLFYNCQLNDGVTADDRPALVVSTLCDAVWSHGVKHFSTVTTALLLGPRDSACIMTL